MAELEPRSLEGPPRGFPGRATEVWGIINKGSSAAEAVLIRALVIIRGGLHFGFPMTNTFDPPTTVLADRYAMEPR